MTANVMSGDRDKCMAAGMNDHINKPIDPNQMLATIAKWITPAQPTAPYFETMRGTGAMPYPEILPELPEVRMDEAVRRMGGSVDAYCTILEKFRSGQQNILAKIRSAIAASDWKKAELLAHTLRGLLGTVGADKLSDKSAELEASIRRRANHQIESLLPAIELKLTQLFDAIDRTFQLREAEKDEVAEAGPIDMTELANLIRLAMSQLEQFDSGVEDTMVIICRMVRGNAGMKKTMASIERLVSSYDYKQGLAELTACARSMDILCEE